MSLQEYLAEKEARKKRDVERWKDHDGDLCMLCHAYGADKRSLFVACFYDVHEVVPEVIDLHGCDTERKGYYLRICKTCRGEFLEMMRSWRADRVAERETPKDHDGSDYDGGAGLIRVREHGRTIFLTEAQYAARPPGLM